MGLYARCQTKKLSILYKGTYCFPGKSFYLGIGTVVTNFYGEYWEAINIATSDTAMCPVFAVMSQCGEQQ